MVLWFVFGVIVWCLFAEGVVCVLVLFGVFCDFSIGQRLGCVSAVLGVCLGFVWGVFGVCLGCVWGVFGLCLGCV